MHFILSFLSFLFVLTILVQSAPTASLDAATLLQNAQEAQQLNAQFQSANSAATGPCTDGDTTCVNNAVATCVNGQFDTSNGTCATTQQCFALPSVTSNGITIACTSEKSAQSLINAAGATGGVTGSGASSGSTGAINYPASGSSISNGAMAAAETAASMNPDCITTTTSTPTATSPEAVITVTVTVTPLFPPVTQTLSPDQASSALASLLAQGGPIPTASSSEPSDVLSTTFSASATPPAIAIYPMATPSAASNTPSSTDTTDTAVPDSDSAGSPANSGSDYGTGYGGS